MQVWFFIIAVGSRCLQPLSVGCAGPASLVPNTHAVEQHGVYLQPFEHCVCVELKLHKLGIIYLLCCSGDCFVAISQAAQYAQAGLNRLLLSTVLIQSNALTVITACMSDAVFKASASSVGDSQ